MKKNSVLSGLIWTFGERITAQVVSLLVTIVLARILDPEHYVPVSIVSIFITIANTFVTAGFGNSLIQKKDADDLDFSTTMIFSTALSIVIYGVLFWVSPFISSCYNEPILTPVLRVMGLRIILASFNTIQHAYVSKQMAFKKFFFSTLGGTILSAIVGISMAVHGFGVWALVAQYLTNTTVDTIVLSFTSGWKPKLQFSFERMKSLYSYGWKLLVSELITTIYSESRAFVLSAFFDPVQLSYFQQGARYPKLFLTNIETSMHKVLFPKLSNEQDDLEKVKELTRKTIRVSAFILTPVFLGLGACGKDVVILLLTAKWLPCVSYMQIMCFQDIFHPVFSAHTRAMKSLGKSKTFMYLTFFRYALCFLMLGLSLWLVKEPHVVIMSTTVSFMATCFAAGFINTKLIRYSLREQFGDVIRSFVIGMVMFVLVVLVGKIPMPILLGLAVKIATGAILYILLSYFYNREVLLFTVNFVKIFLRKRTKA